MSKVFETSEKKQNMGNSQGKESLTREICIEYRDKAKGIINHSMSDPTFAGLCREFVNRCNITEVMAINILKGYYINDYVATQDYVKNNAATKKKAADDSSEYLHWLAEKEAKDNELNGFDMPDKE